MNQSHSTTYLQYAVQPSLPTWGDLEGWVGMYYYSARYYAPPTFISRDPMFEKYPSISPYTYCANNPMKYVDPTGETLEEGDPPKSNCPIKMGNSLERYVNEKHTISPAIKSISEKIKIRETSNSSTPTTPRAPSTASNTSGSSSNAAQTANNVATAGGLVVDASKQIAEIPSVGYNIAYNTTLLKGVNYLKPLGYWATGASFVSDVYLTSTGQQSLGETVTNTAVTGVSLGVGGWPGLVIQANYQASKLYMKTLMKHPDWAPYPSNGLRH